MGGLKSMLLLDLYLLLPLLLLLAGGVSESHFAAASIIGDAACTLVDCGRGSCNGSASDKPPFFDCNCDPGWTQLNVGGLTLPPCILPNCTLDFGCGSAPPPPPPPFLLTNFNLSDPCNLTWCGDGTCKLTSGVTPTCICNEGSSNLLNLTGLPCFKQCNLGIDCPNLGLVPPPPPLSQPVPVPSGGPRAKGDGCCLDPKKNDGGWIRGLLATTVLSMSLQLII